MRADKVEEALPSMKWVSSIRGDPNGAGLSVLEYRRAFSLDILPKFEDFKDELRDGVLCEENVRELRKNIQTEEEYEIEMLSRRFVIPDKILKLIGLCV